MKNIAFIFFWLAAAHSLIAQDFGASLNIGIRKVLQLDKKSSIDFRQQFQFTPEVEKYNNEFGDFFNEDGFWPIPDRYLDDDDDLDDGDDLDDDDDDDDDDNDLPSGTGNGIPVNNGELDDSPRYITLDWRSTSSFQYNYRFFSWLRANTGYGLFYNGTEFRHIFRAELDYRPLRHDNRKRKVDLSARTLFQYTGQPDDGALDWRALLVPRFDIEWAFKKNHLFGVSASMNGRWDDGIFEFDRWRVNTRIVLIYEKIHRFTFGHQYQQRMDKPGASHGLNFGYEVRF